MDNFLLPVLNNRFVPQVVAMGVAAHEGQLFGWPNVALGLIAALGFMTISSTAILMWIRRRPRGTLGAPIVLPPIRIHPAIVLCAVVVLGGLLPLFGASLVTVYAVERLLLPLWPAAQLWLGLKDNPVRSET